MDAPLLKASMVWHVSTLISERGLTSVHVKRFLSAWHNKSAETGHKNNNILDSFI